MHFRGSVEFYWTVDAGEVDFYDLITEWIAGAWAEKNKQTNKTKKQKNKLVLKLQIVC